MEHSTQENGVPKQTCNMGKESKSGKTEASSRVTGKMAERMGSEDSYFKMVTCTQVIG